MLKCFKNKNIICFYINEHEYDIKTVLNLEIPRIYGVINNHTLFIMNLFIPLEMRNRGIGSQLLSRMKIFCRNTGIIKIELDDMSDNFLKNNNIYIKNGFKYKKNTFPEMYFII